MPKNHKGEASVRRPTPGLRLTALVSLAATLIFALSRLAGATTINANSASQSDVAAAIASAADGDTVIIPGGTATWTRTLSVKKAITLQGAGVGSTIIKDNVQSGALILWNISGKTNARARLTGIEFQDGGRLNIIWYCDVTGSNTNGPQFRMDHCKWGEDVNGCPLFDTVIGVIDHNSFVILRRYYTAIFIHGFHWDGRSYGDGSWAAPTDYGSAQFLFIEDNDFVSNDDTYLYALTDAYAGARFVLRHNTAGGFFVANHGTESTGRSRGTRAMEIYRNSFDGHNLNNFVGASRSGGTLFHDNTVTNYWNGVRFTLNNFRNSYPYDPWGGADGTSIWDVNEPNAFFTGTAAQNSSGTTVTVSGSPNWTTNQWVGYTLRRTSNICNSNTLSFSEITSNTSNTITYIDSCCPIPTMAFCAGDTLEIRKVDHAIDQPGRALGSLISGDNPTPPPSWNNQVTEPCYSWNNGGVNFTANVPSIRLNEHYFNNTALPGYTEFTYPHPLVNGGALPLLPSRAATRNATANSQDDAHKKRRPWGGKKPERKQTKKAKTKSCQ